MKVLLWLAALTLTLAAPGPALVLWGVVWLVRQAARPRRELEPRADVVELGPERLRRRFQGIRGPT